MKKNKLLLLLFAIIISSCSSIEKKYYKAVKFFDQNEILASEYCSKRYPIKEKIIKGDPIVTIDTTYIDVPFFVDCDSVKGKGSRIVEAIKKVPCEKKTINVTDTIVVENTAKIAFLEAKNKELEKEVEKNKLRAEIAEKQASKSSKINIALALLIIGFLIYKIVRK